MLSHFLSLSLSLSIALILSLAQSLSTQLQVQHQGQRPGIQHPGQRPTKHTRLPAPDEGPPSASDPSPGEERRPERAATRETRAAETRLNAVIDGPPRQQGGGLVRPHAESTGSLPERPPDCPIDGTTDQKKRKRPSTTNSTCSPFPESAWSPLPCHNAQTFNSARNPENVKLKLLLCRHPDSMLLNSTPQNCMHSSIVFHCFTRQTLALKIPYPNYDCVWGKWSRMENRPPSPTHPPPPTPHP